MLIDSLFRTDQRDIKISLLKTISWRIIGTVDTVIISYVLTGKVDVAFSIGGVELITKMLLYFIHERAWVMIIKR